MARPGSPWKLTLVFAVILAASSFALQGWQGFNISDEGFLWYGVQRTVAGEVPLRDFQSYDPGRYYWSAAVALGFGNGLVALRFSETIAEAIGLWLGLLAACRLSRNWLALLATGLMLTVWVFPSHKIFDHSLLLAGIWMATRLAEQPSRWRVVWGGVFIGLCAFFGRNHALYNGTAEFLLLLWLTVRGELPPTRFIAWATGIVAGSLPLLLMLAFVPGFFTSYQNSIVEILRHGTNLALPMPWPWRIFLSGNPYAVASQLVLGLVLLALPVAYLAMIGASRPLAHFSPERALLAACGAVGLCYLNHAYSRADVSHLAQAIHPFTLGLLALVYHFAKRSRYLTTMALFLTALGLFEVGRQMPAFQRLVSPVAWQRSAVASGVFVPPVWARFFDELHQFAAHIGPREGIFIAPSAPGLYPVLNRVSPVWESYVFFPTSKEREEEITTSLTKKEINWAIVSNTQIDERDDLRFSATYPLVWKYLQENFEPVAQPELLGGLTIKHRKGASPGDRARQISPPSAR